MEEIGLDLWKDNAGYRIEFFAKGEKLSFDLHPESFEKLGAVFTEFAKGDNSYGNWFFDLQEWEDEEARSE